MQEITIDVSQLFAERAKLREIDTYLGLARKLAGAGNKVVITGAGPVWLYLKIAHALHGTARSLVYRSPVTGDVVIFDHNPD